MRRDLWVKRCEDSPIENRKSTCFRAMVNGQSRLVIHSIRLAPFNSLQEISRRSSDWSCSKLHVQHPYSSSASTYLCLMSFHWRCSLCQRMSRSQSNDIPPTPLLTLSQIFSELESNALSKPSAAHPVLPQGPSLASNVHLDRESADEDGTEEGGVPPEEGPGRVLAAGSWSSGCPRKLACRERC